MAPSLQITQMSCNSIKWSQQTFLNLKLHSLFRLLSFLPWSSLQTVPTDTQFLSLRTGSFCQSVHLTPALLCKTSFDMQQHVGGRREKEGELTRNHFPFDLRLWILRSILALCMVNTTTNSISQQQIQNTIFLSVCALSGLKVFLSYFIYTLLSDAIEMAEVSSPPTSAAAQYVSEQQLPHWALGTWAGCWSQVHFYFPYMTFSDDVSYFLIEDNSYFLIKACCRNNAWVKNYLRTLIM